jgi:5''-3'' exonuclease (including N-terminal domain of PolI)
MVDADIVVYRVGFANRSGEPLSYTLQSVKTVMESIYNTFPDAPERRVYLTGKDNFRDKLATIRVYKGNRDPLNKPEYYDEIRQYLIDYHGAEIIDGMEADDKLGIEQWKHKDRSTCIVGIDKDLLCIPGYHFNWVKSSMFYQTLAEANKMYWTQVITGDTTDNIQGIPGAGPKAADKIINASDGTWLDMHNRVLQAYETKFGGEGMKHFHENASLLWIQREEGINYDGKPYS